MRAEIFRLFFEKRFQFAAGLPPTSLRGGMVASDFLRPAYEEAQFAIGITQGWIKFGHYFLQPRDDLRWAVSPILLGKLVFLRRGVARRSDAAEREAQQHAAGRLRLVR